MSRKAEIAEFVHRQLWGSAAIPPPTANGNSPQPQPIRTGPALHHEMPVASWRDQIHKDPCNHGQSAGLPFQRASLILPAKAGQVPPNPFASYVPPASNGTLTPTPWSQISVQHQSPLFEFVKVLLSRQLPAGTQHRTYLDVPPITLVNDVFRTGHKFHLYMSMIGKPQVDVFKMYPNINITVGSRRCNILDVSSIV